MLRIFEHEHVVQEIRQADVLLITLSDLPGAEKIITGKAFEYMAAGKHIFAVVPNGETSNILRKNYNKLTIADASNPGDIMERLLWVVTNREKVLNEVPSDVSLFSRKRLTEKLTAVLNNALITFEKGK